MNVERTLMLLQVLDLSRNWPTLKPIHDKAMEELVEIAAEKPPEPEPAPTPPARSPIFPKLGKETDE